MTITPSSPRIVQRAIDQLNCSEDNTLVPLWFQNGIQAIWKIFVTSNANVKGQQSPNWTNEVLFRIKVFA
jgi:hypothetical protein